MRSILWLALIGVITDCGRQYQLLIGKNMLRSKILVIGVCLFLSEAVLATTCDLLDGAYVEASNGTYLGFFGAGSASESIANSSGLYGSAAGFNSVRNNVGLYGSTSGVRSANNSFSLNPPKIYRGIQFLGYLSTNTTKTPRVEVETVLSDCSFTSSIATRIGDDGFLALGLNATTSVSFFGDNKAGYKIDASETGNLLINIISPDGVDYNVYSSGSALIASINCTSFSNCDEAFFSFDADGKDVTIAVSADLIGTYYLVVTKNSGYLSGSGSGSVTTSFEAIDAAEFDTDGDGTPDQEDVFPNDSSESKDNDLDGVGDNADLFDEDPNESGDNDQDGIGDNADLDDDNDGYADTIDDLPFDNADYIDTDGDGIGNLSDDDDDGDLLKDFADAFPLDDTKPFHNGLLVFSATSSSTTSINGVYQSGSKFSVTMKNSAKIGIQLLKLEFTDSGLNVFASSDDDQLLGGDSRIDPGESFGITLTLSASRSNPIVFRYFYVNPETGSDEVVQTAFTEIGRDSDLDGVKDSLDAFPRNADLFQDSDSDGIDDDADQFPNDRNEYIDSDSDSVGDNSDNCPSLANPDQLNTDGDAEGDVCDLDDDNDGFTDEEELADGTDPLSRFSCRTGCFSFDVDENLEAKPLTDGLLVIRHLFGFSGDSLISGAVSGDASRNGSDAIASYLTDADTQLDIDGDGESKSLTDGLLLIRYLFGFSGDSLISGAIGDGAERDTADEVEAYIQERVPVQ